MLKAHGVGFIGRVVDRPVASKATLHVLIVFAQWSWRVFINFCKPRNMNDWLY